ncbi:sensor histidine kinase YesM [Rhabdobacter roseus]|uniref:Sensor histidine kinase YesM n=1 Tax=Rhabdobacter roseus TaxID=1655419 RepID=A0A840TXY9_9BACT|nr:histidine kinase [Rhabdobacter roseus]MBB5284509.1 sensor histidine kinase YesM [Rhabdobacter roseus]
MKLFKNILKPEIRPVEVAFFLIYFILFPVLSSLEYNFNERNSTVLFFREIPERVLYGALNILPFWLYYKFLVERYLFSGNRVYFSLLLIGFLILLNYYYVLNYRLISHMHFLPESITSRAERWYKTNTVIHFSVVYILRELLVITALAYYIRAARLSKQVETLRRQQLEMELDSLKAQLHPHFFFNTLNNIYGLALQGSAKTADLVARHTGIMRYILYDSARPHVGLEQEIDFIQNYVSVESVRFSERISILFDTQGITNKVCIEPLLLLPYIENAFKHGIRNEIGTGYVQIIICLLGNQLVMEIKNSKPAIELTDARSGIGHTNAQKRLALLYPQAHWVEIIENSDHYEVHLSINLKSR